LRVAPILLLKTKGARIPSMGIIPNFSLVECVAPFPPKMHISMGEGHPFKGERKIPGKIDKVLPLRINACSLSC